VIEEGWIAPAVRDELPELRLRWIDAEVLSPRSPDEQRARLRLLSDRFHGAEAITRRRDPVPHAYRVFFRSIGLDPDATRTPIEAAALTRLMDGAFRSHGRVQDALLLGLVETGVPLWAVARDALDGPLGIREARAGERLGTGPYANELPAGRLVVADAGAPVGVLFGELAPSHVPRRDTTAVRVFCVQVDGVPEIHVEEALWACAEALRDG
jgi:DNA/RNA-binding domain of Phe-tRNA-synthetase-like protein